MKLNIVFFNYWYILLTFLQALLLLTAMGQEPPAVELPWDELLQQEEVNLEDDAILLQWENGSRQKINLNQADATQLENIPGLSAFLIQQLLLHRHLFGELLHMYELQAIPGWSPEIIRYVMPFAMVEESWRARMGREKPWRDGEKSLLLRAGTRIRQGEQRMNQHFTSMLRYRYAFRDRLQYGIVADKDIGEPFFGPVQKAGFDFYSLHFFLRKPGLLSAIAIGDYSINMGQGLIQWQRMAFGKSADIATVKRQSAVLSPYQSAGEFRFFRGIALQLTKRRWELTAFVSQRRLSASVQEDSSGNLVSFSSFRTSGIHQSASEQRGKNRIGQGSAGMVVRYDMARFRVSLNAIGHRFSAPLEPANRPDKFFAIRGRSWWNSSMDWAYTWRNIHWYGEFALDARARPAVSSGILSSLSSQLDMAIIYRNLSVPYQSLYGDAFTSNTQPGNERGLYVSLDWRPSPKWRVQAFGDHYLFPWIRYTSDAPHRAGDYQVLVTHRISRSMDYSFRYRSAWSQSHFPIGLTGGSVLQTNGLRFQQRIGMNGGWELRQRLEWKQSRVPASLPLPGMLYYLECIYQPQLSGISLSGRIQFYNTSDYATRLYTHERDLLYYTSLPAFYGKGMRYYLLIRYKLGKQATVWLKWAQTHNLAGKNDRIGESGEGSAGLSELRLQIRWIL